MIKSSPPPTAIAPVAVAPAAAQSPRNSAFAKLLADTGCTSKYSDDKKADLFCRQLPEQGNDRHRRNRPLRSDELSLKILPSTFIFDVTIKMCDAKATYVTLAAAAQRTDARRWRLARTAALQSERDLELLLRTGSWN